MVTYFLRRLIILIPTFIAITFMVFGITRIVPGGPIEQAILRSKINSSEGGGRISRSTSSSALSEEDLANLRKFYGFDKPVAPTFFTPTEAKICESEMTLGSLCFEPGSYLTWFNKLIHFDLGTSTRYQDPVWDMIKSRIPVSLMFGLTSLILVYLICIPLGIVKAIKHKTTFDSISSIIVFTGRAIPDYIVGVVLLLLFASRIFQWFPMGGLTSDEFSSMSLIEQIKDLLWHAILPLTAYMAGQFASLTILMKNTLLDNLAADYVRTAIAKGVPFPKAVYKHALRNSFIPIATNLGNSIAVFFAGSFLIEKIFNIDGMGLLSYSSLVDRDYPTVIGLLALESLVFLMGNILSDVIVAFVDPRVQFA